MADAAKPEPDDSTNDVSAAPSDASEAPQPTPTAGKRKLARTTLSLREKAIVKSFCEQKVAESKARGELVPSQEILRREVANQFGWSCGRSTLSKIMSMDWRLLRSGHEGGEALRNTNMKRRRRPLFPAFEADLVKFIEAHLGPVVDDEAANVGTGVVDQEAENGSRGTAHSSDSSTMQVLETSAGSGEQRTRERRTLTEALILEEAQRLKQVHGVSDKELLLSVGWLARFKHRNGIRLRKPAGRSSKLHMHQSLEVVTTNGPDASSMTAWSASLMEASSSHEQVTHGESMNHQTAHDTAAVVTDNENSDLLSTSQQSAHLELHAGDTIVTATKRPALCSAQWHPRGLAKGASATDALLKHIPERIRVLSCPCQASATDNDLVAGITGLRVAVVGFGSVVKAFLAAALVGASGFVTCVEANHSNVWLAEQAAENYCLGTLGLPLVNMRFVVGEYGNAAQSVPASNSTEDNGLKELQGQADLVICNCSIQSLEFPASKNAILELAYGLLKVGGEMRMTDLVCSRRLSPSECEEARAAVAKAESSSETSDSTKQLEQQLLLGAPYIGDLRRLYRTLSGDVEIRSVSCSDVEGAAIDVAVASLLPSVAAAGDAHFRQVTFQLFRLPDLEDPPEDYGQTAIFNGTDLSNRTIGIEEFSSSYQLGDNFDFRRGECVAIDGNTAQILQTSWLRRFFSVNGDRSRHRGPFRLDQQQAQARTSAMSSVTSTSEDMPHAVDASTSQSSISPHTTMSASTAEPLQMVDI